MKRLILWTLALVLVLATAASCDGNAPASDTTAADGVTTAAPETDVPTETPTETPTEAPTEAPTEEDITLPTDTDEAATEWIEPDELLDVSVVNPVISNGTDTDIQGYQASGEFSFEYGDALSTSDNNMFIVTNDRIGRGKITAVFSAPEQYNNDNGIVFGMMDDEYEQYYFWEDGPTYYFLFVSDDATLYLAKVSSNGQPWTELHVSAPIPNYTHGDMITISVEFDGEGFIDCYANGEMLITYYDDCWTGGTRYGIRCEVPGVCYTDVIADPNFVSEWW